MRKIALAIAAVMAILTISADSTIAIAVLLVAGILTVSPNGLAFTAVAEHAGRTQPGRVRTPLLRL